VRSLKIKLSFVYTILGLAGLTLTLAFFYYASSMGIYQGAQNRVELLAEELSYSLGILSEQDDMFSTQRLVEKSSTLENIVKIIVVDTQQKVLAHTDKTQVGEFLNSALVDQTFLQRSKVSQTDGGRIIYVSPLHGQSYTSEFHDITGALWVEIDVSRSISELQQTFGRISLAALVILLPFYFAQYFIVKKVVIDRLRNVEEGIVRSTKLDIAPAVTVATSFGSEDEINTLAQTYNYLLTSLRESQKTLKSERDFALHIMENMGEGLTIADSDGRFEYVNPAYARFLGVSPEEAIGRTPDEFTHPDYHNRLTSEWERRKQGGTSSYETRIVAADGRETNALISSVPRITDGKFSGSIAVITDISQRARIEQMTASLQRKLTFEELTAHLAATFMNMSSSEIGGAIQETLGKLGELFEVDRTYIFEFSSNGESMSNTYEWCAKGVSPQIENLQNLPSEILPWWVNLLKKGETINVPRVSEMPPEAATEQQILAEQDIQSVLVTPIHSDNELLGFLGLDSVVRERQWSKDEIQFLQVLMGIVMNTITRQRAEEKLRESESRNRAFLDAIPDLIFRIDGGGTFLDFRAADDKGLFVAPEDIIGSRIEDILPSGIARETMNAIETALKTNKPQEFEYKIQTADETLTYDAHIVPTSPREVIVVSHNISERVRLEQMKTDFINRASHELRTPLTTAILMADLLEGSNTDEERRQFIEILKQELKRQRLLLDDLLVAGRIESKRFQVRLSPVELLPVIEEAVSSVKPQADARQLDIRLEAQDAPPATNTDRQALLQVLLNLLSNAIKFSKPGGDIEVSARELESNILIVVRDHGIGIPAQDLPNITSRFFRAQNATELEIPGTGIGLYIIKEILEALGGRLEIESVEKKGTTVSVFLPLPPASAGDDGEAPA
jgi:PAS domain S-box-containing protein